MSDITPDPAEVLAREIIGCVYQGPRMEPRECVLDAGVPEHSVCQMRWAHTAALIRAHDSALVAQYQARISDLEHEAALAFNEVFDRETDLWACRRLREIADNTKEAFRERAEAAEARCKELEAKSAADEAQCDEMTRTAAELSEKVTTLEGKLAEMTRDRDAYRDALVTRHGSDCRSLSELAVERARQVEALREENATLEMQYAAVHAWMCADKKRADTAEIEVDALRKALKVCRSCETHSRAIEALTKRLQAREKLEAQFAEACKAALCVGEIHFKTCVLSSQVNRQLTAALAAYDAAQQPGEKR